MRITVPENSIAVLMSMQLAEELYNLCSTIRKGKRLQITPPVHAVAGEVMLALLAAGGMIVFPKGEEE